jgi:hypothetical protein
MAIRVRHNVLVQISADTDGNDKRFYPTTKEVVIDGFDRQQNKNFSVAASASEAMDIGDVTAPRGLYMECSADVDVVLNGSETLNMRVAAGQSVAKLFYEGVISSVSVDNTAGASAVTGEFVIWGDVTP